MCFAKILTCFCKGKLSTLLIMKLMLYKHHALPLFPAPPFGKYVHLLLVMSRRGVISSVRPQCGLTSEFQDPSTEGPAPQQFWKVGQNQAIFMGLGCRRGRSKSAKRCEGAGRRDRK